jgi:hypothetical protein
MSPSHSLWPHHRGTSCKLPEITLKVFLKLCVVKSSVVDPDLDQDQHGSAFILLSWILISIGYADPDA